MSLMQLVKKSPKKCANKTGSKTVAKSDDVENEAELHPVDRTTDNADAYLCFRIPPGSTALFGGTQSLPALVGCLWG